MTEYRNKLVCILTAGRQQLLKGSKRVSIPALVPDMPGQQHEITCVSLVILNSHVPKMSPDHHRKTLIVIYDKRKVSRNLHPEADRQLAKDAGIDDVKRILIYRCTGIGTAGENDPASP